MFFFWGFIHNLDPVLIPHLRKSFNLNTIEASLVDSAIFIAYFLVALPAGFLIKRWGYKIGILTGLCLFALGCFLFVPAANIMSYAFFLSALFIVACGLATLETAANPYVTLLGSPEKATQRLNLAQSFNGLAAFLAPILGGHFILSETPKSANELNSLTKSELQAYLLSETASVKAPYTIIGIIILVIALVFVFISLPEPPKTSESLSKKSFFGVLKRPQLKWAVIAQFFYIGAQVCITSFLILFAETVTEISTKGATYYAGLTGLLFMTGRFTGTLLMRYIKPRKLMAVYAFVSCILCLEMILGSGMWTLYSMVGSAFFMSIMFPTIFALGIKDLGPETEPGSSWLIMSIVGGALLPPLLGFIADESGNLQYGYTVPLISFIVILVYSIKQKSPDMSLKRE